MLNPDEVATGENGAGFPATHLDTFEPEKEVDIVAVQKDIERLANQGKMMPRKRIEKLLDPGTPFLEFSTLAANMAYDGEAPSASVVRKKYFELRLHWI